MAELEKNKEPDQVRELRTYFRSAGIDWFTVLYVGLCALVRTYVRTCPFVSKLHTYILYVCT